MTAVESTTVPVRCLSCGQQTHKTLESIRQNSGFVCACGVATNIDIDEFVREIRKAEGQVRDFGRQG